MGNSRCHLLELLLRWRERLAMSTYWTEISVETSAGAADVVVANLSTADILDLLPQVPRVLKSAGTFIASGIPSSRRLEVEAGLQQTGFVVQGLIEREEWVTLAAHLHKVNGAMGQ